MKGKSKMKLFLRFSLVLFLFLSMTDLTSAQSFQLNVDGYVRILAVDPLGRKTGYDATTGVYFQEIPGVNFGSASIGIRVGDSTIADPSEKAPIDAGFDDVPNGEYKFIFLGTRLSVGDVDIMVHHNDEVRATHYVTGSIVDSGMVVVVLFHFDFQNKSNNWIRKEISQDYVNGELAAMRKKNWIFNQGTADKYLSLFSTAFTYIEQRDFATARTTLETIQTELGKDSIISIRKDAVSDLRSDANGLIGQLPSVPVVASLEPSTALAGSSGFRLTVSGSYFVRASTVYWNGSARTTTFLADTSLRATILASDVAKVDSPLVTVKNPDGSESNALRFTILKTVPMLLDDLRALLAQLSARGEVGDGSFVKQFDKDLQQAKQEYEKRDSIGCAQELESFQRELKKEYLAKPKKNDNRFVTEDAYKLLYFNAQYVMERAITLPPRSYAPLVDQLTSLRAQIRSDAQQGFLGGEILLKGLEIMVDGAKQRLQRRDSVGTALYVSFFQQTVRQTYELTKGRPIGKIYVKPEGYISLYYRAGYILEKLPEPLGQFMPRMEPELEQELQRYQRQVEQQK